MITPKDATHAAENKISIEEKSSLTSAGPSLLSKIFWTPRWCRYDPSNPPVFSPSLNILFAFAGAFTVANLYYNHPILNVLAEDFNVSNLEIAKIPTLAQVGYLVGLLLICPLGDFFPRRPYTLILIFFTATLWIGLCITRSFNVFLGLTFVTSITTVTPQIMLPLVGELAPPHRRPLALSVVVSGNLLGIVLARILSGVVTNYTYWRNIYWIALALQYLIFTLLYLFMPAYPATNTVPGSGWGKFKGFLKIYPGLLFSIIKLVFKYPVLIQASMVSYCTSMAMTNYWTTLTFLLAGSPYHLSPTPIGLFGLIGVACIILSPLYAKYIIQPLKIPLYATILGQCINLVGVIIGTYTGTYTLAGPIIQALLSDTAISISQVANRTSISSVEPTKRNRVNTVFMLFSFLGQITGTVAGNEIYQLHGGWTSSGSLSVASLAFSLVVCTSRGPHEKGWIGWGGGWGRQDNRTTSTQKADTIQTDVMEEATATLEKDTTLENGQRVGSTNKLSKQLSRQYSYGSDGHAMANNAD